MSWQDDIRREQSALYARFKAAEARVVAALEILSRGSGDDVDVATTYLGHLKNLADRWTQKSRELARALNDNNGIQAMQKMNDLSGYVGQVEQLAPATEARASKVGRRPGAPAPGAAEGSAAGGVGPVDADPAEADRGFPVWVLLPVGLVVLLLLGGLK